MYIYPPRLQITTGVLWTSYDWLKAEHSCSGGGARMQMISHFVISLHFGHHSQSSTTCFWGPIPHKVRWITSNTCVYVMICTCQWHVNTTVVFHKMKTSLSNLTYPVCTLTMNCKDYIHWPLCLHIYCMQNTLIQQSPSVLMKYLNDIHFVLSEQQILCNLYALCHNSIVVLWRYCVDVII